jgi:hypothetical protein
MTYTANCPCGKGVIVIPIPVAIFGKGCVLTLFGERFVVTLLEGCILLVVLTILTLGNVHAVFGILNVLAFGDVHAVFGILNVLAFGNVHAAFGILAVLNLGMLAQLVVAWRGMGPANDNMNI